MEGASELVVPSSTIMREEISANATILDEGIRVCPICHSEVRHFFMHYYRKILMCENYECDYPFGIEEIELIEKETNETQWDEEAPSIQSKTTQSSLSATMSMSTSSWSELDNINRVCEAEERLARKSDSRKYYSHRKGGVSKDKEENDNEENNEKAILKEVALINKLNVELLQKEGGKPHIKNEKWIKNLMCMQEMSGMALLNPEEMKMVKKQPKEVAEFDINLSRENSMSSIKIEIANSKDKNLKKIISLA